MWIMWMTTGIDADAAPAPIQSHQNEEMKSMKALKRQAAARRTTVAASLDRRHSKRLASEAANTRHSGSHWPLPLPLPLRHCRCLYAVAFAVVACSLKPAACSL
jgi:hypothetical protein